MFLFETNSLSQSHAVIIHLWAHMFSALHVCFCRVFAYVLLLSVCSSAFQKSGSTLRCFHHQHGNTRAFWVSCHRLGPKQKQREESVFRHDKCFLPRLSPPPTQPLLCSASSLLLLFSLLLAGSAPLASRSCTMDVWIAA